MLIFLLHDEALHFKTDFCVSLRGNSCSHLSKENNLDGFLKNVQSNHRFPSILFFNFQHISKGTELYGTLHARTGKGK
jgi:hypothetical protein